MKLPSKMHQSWEPIVAPLIKDAKFSEVKKMLGREQYFYPYPADLVFNAFNIELRRLRAIICGQSPYPNALDAHGIAFSIPDNERLYEKWPPSLKVIAKDICQTDDPNYISTHFEPNLECWMHQGVLLINKALTVGSKDHIPYWSWFVEGLIRNISKIERPLIFYFLGNPARKLSSFVLSKEHCIFESIHPAALAYNPQLHFDGKFKEVAEKYREINGFELHYILPF